MESGERLPSSTASSTTPTASSTPSVASAVSKGGLSTGAASLSSTINTCGHLFRAAGDQPFNLATVSSAFPMVSHPVFGLHSASSGHSEFGGLGTLGTPTALAAHPQLASFPGAEWWRTTDVHTRTGAAFFPPLLGIPPLFAPPAQNHDSSSFHSRTSGKSNRNGPEKGVNGSVNGNSPSSVIGINTTVLSSTASSSLGQAKSTSSGGGNRKCNQEQNKNQPLDARADKIKDKKPRKKTMESSSNSDSESGTSSDTSSEGISSSDSDDLEEDEEEEDQSIEESEDDDSDSEGEAQHQSTSQVLLHGIADPKADGQKAAEKAQEKRLHQPLPLVSESQTHPSFQSQPKQPQVLSQQLPFIFQSSQAKEESVNKHTSVIQSTGLVSNVKPLSLVNQAKKEAYMKLIVPSPEVPKAGNKNTSEESSSLTSELRSKREQYKQTFPSQLKKQESSKSLKKVIAALSNPKATSSSPAHPKQTLENSHPNPFLTNALLGHHQPNGVIQSVIQEAPLALTTKTKMQTKINENIATSSSTPFSSPVNLSTSGRRTPGNQPPALPSTSPILHSQGKEKAVGNNVNVVKTQHHSHQAQSLVEQFRGTDSDIPSSKDSEDSNEDEEEDDEEEDEEDDEDDESDDSQSGTSKRRRVADERELHIPLEYGWQRETRIRNFGGRLQGEVAYYAPCGKKLRQYPEVIKGMQWCLLKEEDVIPRIRAMESRRGRPPNPERQRAREESRLKRRKGRPPNVGNAEFLENTDAKLLRKLQAQEIARQAAQIKLLRKLQRQEQARVAKEAKKQQAIMAAEEKRKQKEQIKIMKQQEKIKRIQQIRMEKELRAQQILEAKKKKKEEAANAKLLEAEKRIKEKEMRRQQAVLLKHQERERRRQHMMLMKAMEARKKAEEKERLKQEKRDEKRLNKERKLEQRRLELEIAKELKKPNEDMCLADQKPLPELPRIPGLVLSGSTFSDCLMVVQFLRNFGKVLGFDVNIDVPNLSVLQEGLLNIGDSMGEVQDLLVRLLSAAVCDPGLVTGYKAKTALGDHLLNVGVNRDNVSEILQIFMEAHCGQTELTESLKTKAFQAHTPAQKASILALLINELACSKSVVSEIDKNIDYMSNLRRDKWMVEGKLRKLRIIHAKKTGKRDTSGGIDLGEEPHPLGTPTPGRKRRRKGGDSDDDDDDDDDSDDQADEDEEDEDDKEDKKGKKTDICEEEDEGDQAASVEELEKQIEKLSKQQSQYRRKLFDASHSLRSMMFGQDRYRRRYWILPQCGGIFVEGMESGEGLEEIAKEREKLKRAESIQVKEETFETSGDTLNCSNTDHCEQKEDLKEKDNTNLFLQKPGSFSKLSKLLEVAKMPPEAEGITSKPNASANGCTLSYQSSGKHPVGGSPSTTSQSNVEKTDSNNLFSTGASGPGKFYSPLPNDQLLKTLTEKNRQWFSLLPRTPCDDTSLTHADPPAAASATPQSQPPSKSPSPAPAPLLGSASAQNAVGLSPFALSPLQVKSGVSMMGLQFCGWPTSVLASNIQFTSPLPSLGPGLGLSEGNGNSFLTSNAASSKSESPVPQSEKTSSVQPAAVEVAKPVDFPSPKPIPEEMQFGWWRIIDPEDLKTLLKVLHLRGIREKALQKQIQKHLDYITQACIKNKDVAIIELNENEENQVTRDTVENWSVEEQAMEMDLSILQQVEDLERRVASASLQVKGWMCPEPASEREDLVYFEHKSFTKLCKEHDGEFTGEEESSAHALERKSDNPLDIAVTRLADLERNIERRTEEDIAPGLRVWRRAVSEARSAAQVALCIQQLQKSIAWEKSIMKVYCQICRKGDNEELLLLCDGCDKGCHTYCHRPKITTIPDGDWFCPACIAKASGQTLKIKKLHVKGKKTNESKKGKKVALPGDTEDEDSASTSSSLKRGNKDLKKRKIEENTSVNLSKQDSFTSVKKPKRDDSKDLAICSMILTEMETHEDAWPFLLPVNLKLVPGYKKVIKKPMDFSTIREKLSSGQYPNLETFAVDVRLVFDNCETFNEDDSDIGRAGHSMRKYFEKKWTDTFKVS
ncbi:bromodomain adjacent to zinc finger domain protein 2B isoform X10 [Ochotona princeps]|uniref:bromodomain adjacent to zinc finger domain protein 2B isoform X10 n=1 Tax=Ochotona princeps TaxID=9978 RepID=UPI002714F890|nr:bromodomain adjacent to zinc finger domain protein 2B isoform X10 [Ochotona princeps]